MNARLAALDERRTQSMQQAAEANPRWSRIAPLLAHSGDSIVCYLVFGAGYAFAAPAWRAASLRLLFLMTINALVVAALKYLIRRERPSGEWGAVYRVTDPHSFPSGHAARTTLIAVDLLLHPPCWPGLLLLVWALAVARARVGLSLHYFSDICAGALIGTLLALLGLWLF